MSAGTKGFSRDMEIFETSDLSEKDPNYEDDRKSQSVEMLDSSMKTSFGKFKGKHIGAHHADFSDNVGRPLQFGFKVDPEDYEMSVAVQREETIMQRYHRLKQEVADLITDIDQLKESDKEFGTISPADIVSDLHQLQKQLHQLELERTLTTSALTGGDQATHSLVFKDLQTQLATLKSQSTENQSNPVYEVYANLESAKFGHLSKLSELEGRLSLLENLVGKSDSKGSIVAAGLDAEYKDLSGAVLALQAKVSLLDVSHISCIKAQLQELTVTMKQLQEKAKEIKEESDQKTKVSEALEMISSVTPLISLVPDLVDRLHTLKDLHEHAAQLTSTVATVSEGQDNLSKQIKTLNILLEQVKDSVGGNLETLQSNVSNLESRITSLQK